MTGGKRTAAVAILAAAAAAGAPFLLARPLAGAASVALLLLGTGGLLFLSRYFVRHGVDPLSPAVAFPLAALAWFSLASIPLLSDREGHRPPMPLTAWLVVAPALAAYAAGAAGFPMAALRPRIKAVASPPPLPAHAAFAFEPARLFAVLAAITAASSAALALVWARRGLPFVSGTMEEMRLEAISSGYESFVGLGVVSVAILVFAHAATLPPGTKLERRFVALAAVAIALLALTGGRGFVAIPLGAGIFLRHQLKKPFTLFQLAGLGALFALFASAYLVVRGMSHYGVAYFADYLRTITLLPEPLAPLAPVVLGVRAGPAAFGEILAVVPSEVPFQGGRFLLSPLVSFLPGHQEWAPAFIQRVLRHDFPGFGEPATLFGSFYLDFGVPGVLAGAFLTGLAWRLLRRRFDERRDLFHAILLALAGVFILFSLYGDLYGFSFFFLWNAGICFTVIALAGRHGGQAPCSDPSPPPSPSS